MNKLLANTNIPLLLPSPFVEGQPPFWTPTYKLPGFLYAHLDAYPINAGTKILLPARLDPQGEQYATTRIRQDIVPAGRFIIYGGSYSVSFWLDWLATQPDLANWDVRQIGTGEFGDVEIVMSQARKH